METTTDNTGGDTGGQCSYQLYNYMVIVIISILQWMNKGLIVKEEVTMEVHTVVSILL